jgi:GxxExxY protein
MIHNQKLLFPQESYAIVGAAMKVHEILGGGFTEKVYQDALVVEFSERGIPFQRETEIHANYKGVTLSSTFIPDFICYNSIILELKAVREIEDIHRSQALNYAKVANMRLALLINFGTDQLEYERFPVFR